MSAFKYVEGNKQIDFIYPYQDILISMTEALKTQDFSAYIDLVAHLKNMSILAFDKNDISRLERIDEIIIILKKYIDNSVKEVKDSSSLYNIENINSLNCTASELKILIEYRFSSVTERICISALRKTIFRDQVPEAQGSIFYESDRDIKNTIRLVNSVFEEYSLKPCEVNL